MAENKNIVPISSFKPNSHKYNEQKSGERERPKVDKVISGDYKVKEKPLRRKFADAFLVDDAQTVKGYLFFDVLIPAIKNAIFDMVSDGLEMMMFGTARGRRGKGGSANERTSYTAYYKSGARNNRRNDDVNRDFGSNYRDIVLDSKDEAEEVLRTLVDLTVDYEAASVADLWDALGVSKTGNFTDEKYGWTDLGRAGVRRVRDGYLLELPKAQPLD